MPTTSPLRCGRCPAVAGDLRNARRTNPAQRFVHIRRRLDASSGNKVLCCQDCGVKCNACGCGGVYSEACLLPTLLCFSLYVILLRMGVLRKTQDRPDGGPRRLPAVAGRAVNSGGPGVPQDPLAPRRGPLGCYPYRQSSVGNAPTLVSGLLAGL